MPLTNRNLATVTELNIHLKGLRSFSQHAG
jgi:hypothetical protein